MTKTPKPKDLAEAIALFRAEVLGGVDHRELGHGDLILELEHLSLRYFTPPGAAVSRRYSISTLERWLSTYRTLGLEGLKPKPRSDRGRAKALTKQQHKLLLDIRTEFPSAGSPLIIKSLVRIGLLDKDSLTPSTLNRFYASHDLRRTRNRTGKTQQRLRWRAERAHALWHADVCHGPTLKQGGKKIPLRIHGILDDYSRDIIALEALSTEKEMDMLLIYMRAVILRGRSDALFLDNGSTYRGERLALVCERLGTNLIHARPYQPEGRGKIERFWRTLREQCLDYISETATMADVKKALAAFLVTYRKTAHAGLMGDTPLRAVTQGASTPVSEAEIDEAFTVNDKRSVKGDSTISVARRTYQVGEYHLANKKVTISLNLRTNEPADYCSYRGKRYPIELVDELKNGLTRRIPVSPDPKPDTGFDPNKARLQEAAKAIRAACKKAREDKKR